MIVAVNTRFLLEDHLEGVGYFTKEIFSRLAKQYPQHQFYFLFDRPFSQKFIFSSNITPLVIGPPTRHPLLWKYWFDIKLPSVLKKIKADVFVSVDGMCSLRTKVPQCVVVHDLGFLHFADGYKKSHLNYFKKNTPKFLKKAKKVATVSQFSKADMLHHYKIDETKIDIAYSAAKDVFVPTDKASHPSIKENYTEGKEYFIYVGAIQPRKNLINLLKAFSIFKKRQKSSMKLVLVGRLAWKNDEFLSLLKTYKFRNDVVMLNDYLPEEELVKILGAAYCLVYPSFFEGFGVPVLEAMKCNVPVVTSVNSSMQEIGEDAALYCDPAEPADIADKMMLLYKDEDLRKNLIKKGNEITTKYSWQRTADLLWKTIEEAVKN